MGIVLRADKGAPLLASEIDGNFSFLLDQITALQSGVTAEGLASVSIDADGITLTGTLGSVWGPLAIPVSIRAKGVWATATVYAVNDLIQNGGDLYLCKIAHVSGTFADDVAAGNLVLAYTGTSGGGGGGDIIGLPAYPTSNAPSGTYRVVKFNEDNGSGGPSASWGWVTTDEVLVSGGSGSLTELLNALDTRIAALEGA